MEPHRSLGQVLVDAGIITPDQLEVALQLQDEAGGHRRRLGQQIVVCGFASEESIAQALADQLSLTFIDLHETVMDPALSDLVPRRLAERHLLVPVMRSDSGGIVLAMSDPTNVLAVDDVRVMSGVSEIFPAVATAAAVKEAINRIYSLDAAADEVLDQLGLGSQVEMLESGAAPAELEDLAALERLVKAAPIVSLVNTVLARAVRDRATDVHIEPKAAQVQVRFRVDGLLREAMSLPKNVQASVISRIKIMSGMDISERRRPQDGGGTIRVDKREVDMRVSTLPTPSGEKVVIRLLRKGEGKIELMDLGMNSDQLAIARTHLSMPQGMIVFTGPTGAGKTTTMYAGLTEITTPEKNITTLEDPIEYQIPALNQVQIDERTGVTFPVGLRTILRQDPDIIMVGEIRDGETAQIAIQASLTGHLVLSSLHTNDAISAVTRLIDIGVEPFLISSALSMVIAVRLVRVVCERCRRRAEPSDEVLNALGLSRKGLAGVEIVEGSGCARCAHTGYLGRTGVFEVLPVTREMRQLIYQRASEDDLLSAARGNGVLGLKEDGLEKARSGITTLEEVLRVTMVSA